MKIWKIVIITGLFSVGGAMADTIEMGYKVFARNFYVADVIVKYDNGQTPAVITMKSETRGLVSLFKSGAFDFQYTPNVKTIQLVFSDGFKRFQYQYEHSTVIPTVSSLKYDFSDNEDDMEITQEVWRGDSFFGVLHRIMAMDKTQFVSQFCPKEITSIRTQIFTTRSTYQMNVYDAVVPLNRPVQKDEGEIAVQSKFACDWDVRYVAGSDEFVDAFENGQTWFGVVEQWSGIIPIYHTGDGSKGSTELIMTGVAVNNEMVAGVMPKIGMFGDYPEYWERIDKISSRPFLKIPVINPEDSKK